MLTHDVKIKPKYSNQSIQNKQTKPHSKQASQDSGMVLESPSHLIGSLAICSVVFLSSSVETMERGTWAKENVKETSIKHFHLLTLFFLPVVHGSSGRCLPGLA